MFLSKKLFLSKIIVSKWNNGEFHAWIGQVRMREFTLINVEGFMSFATGINGQGIRINPLPQVVAYNLLDPLRA